MATFFRNVGLFGVMLLCELCVAGVPPQPPRKQLAGQQPGVQSPPMQGATVQPASGQAATPQVPPPPVPEQLPATPPKVSMNGGQLTIVADNSTLGDVLNAVKKLTGAGVEVPNAASYERVVAQLGPGQPQQVLQQLLTGSKFDYIILGSADNPDAIQKIILTPRGGGGGGNSGPSNMTANRPPVNNQQAFVNQPDADNGVEDEIQQEPPQPEQPPQPELPPQQEEPQQQPPQQNGPNGPKTPEQLLQELQRLQQQGQAGRPPQ